VTIDVLLLAAASDEMLSIVIMTSICTVDRLYKFRSDCRLQLRKFNLCMIIWSHMKIVIKLYLGTYNEHGNYNW
jgi:hypothetical protein